MTPAFADDHECKQCFVFGHLNGDDRGNLLQQVPVVPSFKTHPSRYLVSMGSLVAFLFVRVQSPCMIAAFIET
jgi:hypothetical protein